jgi:uncharacterized protein
MMEGDWLFWLLAGLATLLVGASKGGVPGIGILAVPVLSQVISPVVAAGLLLPVYIVSDIYGLWLYRKSYNIRIIKIVGVAATIGVLIGWALARYNNDAVVKLIVGTIGLWYAADIFIKARQKSEIVPKPADVPRGMFWGTIAGFTSFVAHAGGTPYQMYALPQKLDKMTYAGTATILFTYINLIKLPPYWMLGQINVGSLKTCLILAPISFFGAWAGYRLTKALPSSWFFRFVEVALFLVSLKLIYDGSRAFL